MRQIYYTLCTLLRECGSNIIRVISLSLGLTIGVLLFSQIAFELSYEQCYPEAERLALVRCQMTNASTGETRGDDGENSYDYTVFDVVAATLAQDMPDEIETASCVLPQTGFSIYYEDKLLSDINYIYGDTCFFQTFGIPVLKGTPKDMIMPGSVFVSQSFARRIFGDENPIGKVLSADKRHDFTIRGIYKDVPENTMLVHDFVVSVHRNGGYQGGAGWRGNDVFYAFLRLRDASDIDKVNSNIQRVIKKYTSLDLDGWKVEFSAIPLVKRHLSSPEVQKRLAIYGFLGFAVFFVAIMNYMLISIATLSRRAKGVGVHKCNGASSTNIFNMFLVETGVLVIISVLLSFLLIFNTRGLIEDLLSVRLSSLFTWETLWVPLLIMGAVTHYPCTFHRGGRHAGTTIFTYSRHASVPSVYRRKERLETLSAICAIYRSIFRFGVTIGHFITVQSSYEPRYGDRCAWFDSSRKLASRRDGSAYKG